MIHAGSRLPSLAATIKTSTGWPFNLTGYTVLLDVRRIGAEERTISGATMTIVSATAGTGGLPFILPYPKIVQAGSVLAVTFVNFTAAVSYHVRLALHGWKIFASMEGT